MSGWVIVDLHLAVGHRGWGKEMVRVDKNKPLRFSRRGALMMLHHAQHKNKTLRCALVNFSGYKVIEVTPTDTIFDLKRKIREAEEINLDVIKSCGFDATLVSEDDIV